MSTKSKAWKEFKQVKDELLSKYNASERAKITKPLMRALLGPAGKEFHNDESKYNHEFEFVRCKVITDEQKDAKYAEWIERIKSGEFAPEKKVIKKPAPKKRGETLDDLTLDDEAEEIEIVEPEDASPDVEVNEPSKAMEQEKWEALPVEERAKITIEKQKQKPKPKPATKQPEIIDKLNEKTIDAMKKHKEEITMASTPEPKSKKELLLELLTEDNNSGITEEKVEEIAMRVVIKVLTDLNNEVSEEKSSLLRNYIETHKAIEASCK